MKKMSMFALLLAAVLVTSYSVSGTYAKYTSTFTNTDSARVAKWAFSFSGNSVNTDKTFTFNLFNTVKDTNSDEADTDIKVSDGTIIAPGTEGSFVIGLKNDSEVNAKYSIDFSMTETDDIPVEFSTNKTNWVSDINSLDISDTNISMNAASETTHTVYWRWVFEVDEAGNEADTDLGLDGNDTIEVTAKITATQID